MEPTRNVWVVGGRSSGGGQVYFVDHHYGSQNL